MNENIIKHFFVRSLGGSYLEQLEDFSKKIGGKEKYDEWLFNGIKNYKTLEFINGLEKEIDLFLLKNKDKNFSLENQKANLLKIIFFDTYISLGYINIQDNDINIKNKIKDTLLFIEKYYNDNNKLALKELKDYIKNY